METVYSLTKLWNNKHFDLSMKKKCFDAERRQYFTKEKY